MKRQSLLIALAVTVAIPFALSQQASTAKPRKNPFWEKWKCMSAPSPNFAHVDTVAAGVHQQGFDCCGGKEETNFMVFTDGKAVFTYTSNNQEQLQEQLKDATCEAQLDSYVMQKLAVVLTSGDVLALPDEVLQYPKARPTDSGGEEWYTVSQFGSTRTIHVALWPVHSYPWPVKPDPKGLQPLICEIAELKWHVVRLSDWMRPEGSDSCCRDYSHN